MEQVLSTFDIVYDVPHAVYSGGQTVSGSVVIGLQESVTVQSLRITFVGRAKVGWGSGSSGYTDEEVYFDQTAVLVGAATLPAGRHVYPFVFNLPERLPSSFSGEYGNILYFARATIDQPNGGENFECKAAFTVMPVEATETKTNSCCCFDYGSVQASFVINKMAFVPGESIVVNAKITNDSSSEVDFTKVVLKQYVEFLARPINNQSSERQKMTSSEVVAQYKRYVIRPHDTEEWTNQAFRVPAVPPSRLDGCDIINVTYLVKFYVRTWNEIAFVNEVTIGTVPRHDKANFLFAGQPVATVTEQPMSIQPTAPPMAELPPPSYEECVKGQREIRDEQDSEFTRGQLSWAPSYPTYNWPPGGATGAHSYGIAPTAPRSEDLEMQQIKPTFKS